jgi:hypothetical protein
LFTAAHMVKLGHCSFNVRKLNDVNLLNTRFFIDLSKNWIGGECDSNGKNIEKGWVFLTKIGVRKCWLRFLGKNWIGMWR